MVEKLFKRIEELEGQFRNNKTTETELIIKIAAMVEYILRNCNGCQRHVKGLDDERDKRPETKKII